MGMLGRDSCYSYHECTRAKVCCTILFICTCTRTIVCCPIVDCTIVQLYTQTHGCLCVLPLLFRCPGLSHSRRQGLFVPDKRNTSTRIYFGWNTFYENSHEEWKISKWWYTRPCRTDNTTATVKVIFSSNTRFRVQVIPLENFPCLSFFVVFSSFSSLFNIF